MIPQPAPTVVLPWAALVIMRDCGPELREQARRLEAAPQTREAGRQLRLSLDWMEAASNAQAEAEWARRAEAARARVTEPSASACGNAAPANPAPGLDPPPTSTTVGCLSAGQVAERLSVTSATVTADCRNGRLSATKLGRDWVITPDAFDDYKRWRETK